MPGIPARYDPNDKTINELGDAERAARLSEIRTAWRYYDGAHKEWLKARPGDTATNITLNLCGRTVDKLAEFIGVPERVELPGGVDNVPVAANALGEVKTPEQEALETFYTTLRDDLPEIITSGIVVGHTFVKLYIDESSTPQATLLDPEYVTVFWDRMNRRRVLFYRLQWAHGDEAYRQDIVPSSLLPESSTLAAPADTWVILDYEQKRGGQAWALTQSEVWAYPFAPIVSWVNKRRAHQYYGVGELGDAIQLNDAVNFIASNTAQIIKFHAHPRTIGKGFEAGDVEQTSIDGLFTVPENADVYNLEMQSDLASSMNMLNMLRAEFFANQRVVDSAGMKDRVGQLTNFGLRVLYSDQIENAQEKQRLMARGLAELMRRMLVIAGIESAPTPAIIWGDPLPDNRIERLQAAQIEKDLGFTSMQTLAQDLSRDYLTEQERRAEERATNAEGVGALLESMAVAGRIA